MAWCTAALLAIGGALTPLPERDLKDGPDIDLKIYIESEEVRVRIVTNLAFIDVMTDATREVESILDPVEAQGTLDALVRLMEANNGIVIDGIEVAPITPTLRDSFDYSEGDPSLYAHFPTYGARAVVQTALTLRYPCKTAPSSVTIDWGIYPPNHSEPPDENGVYDPVQPIARLVADGLEQIVRFTPEDARFTWVRSIDGSESHAEEVPLPERKKGGDLPPIALALLGVALVGAFFGPKSLRRPLFGPAALLSLVWVLVQANTERVAMPKGDAARAVFEPLLTNIYRAFDYTERSTVYDVLEQSASGPVLRDLYDDIAKGLKLQEEEGDLCRAERVTFEKVVDGEVASGVERRFAVLADWIVDGVVYHSDHGHTQKNGHKALFEVEATESGWKIASYEVLEQRRLDATPLSGVEAKTPTQWESFEEQELPKEF